MLLFLLVVVVTVALKLAVTVGVAGARFKVMVTLMTTMMVRMVMIMPTLFLMVIFLCRSIVNVLVKLKVHITESVFLSTLLLLCVVVSSLKRVAVSAVCSGVRMDRLLPSPVWRLLFPSVGRRDGMAHVIRLRRVDSRHGVVPTVWERRNISGGE